MKKQTNNCLPFLLMSAWASIAFTACQRDHLVHPGGDGKAATETAALSERSHAPAAHIRASEKLAIPGSVALPANLPHGNARVATYYAVGVQIYKSREKAGSAPIAYEWALVAPRAELYGAGN